MLSLNFCGKFVCDVQNISSKHDVENEIRKRMGFENKDYYLIANGKILGENCLIPSECPVHLIPRLVGGKGGFGSMLRAIGAQIEKTTNREACRDLSGRRLRDINEEKRLKTWIAQQVEREKEAEDRRQKKLERLCKTPKHEFKDEFYEKERLTLPEKVEDALEQGLKASSSTASCSTKRKLEDKTAGKKKARLWLDQEEELSVSEDDEEENEDILAKNSQQKQSKVENDSGEENSESEDPSKKREIELEQNSTNGTEKLEEVSNAELKGEDRTEQNLENEHDPKIEEAKNESTEDENLESEKSVA